MRRFANWVIRLLVDTKVETLQLEEYLQELKDLTEKRREEIKSMTWCDLNQGSDDYWRREKDGREHERAKH